MPITDKHPDTQTHDKTQTLLQRADESRAFLVIGGLLSEAENRKVKERMLRWCQKFQGVKVK